MQGPLTVVTGLWKRFTAVGDIFGSCEGVSVTKLRFANDFPQREIDRDKDTRHFLTDLVESSRESSSKSSSSPALALAISANRSDRNSELQELRLTSRRSSITALLRSVKRIATLGDTEFLEWVRTSFDDDDDQRAFVAPDAISVSVMLTRLPAGWAEQRPPKSRHLLFTVVEEAPIVVVDMIITLKEGRFFDFGQQSNCEVWDLCRPKEYLRDWINERQANRRETNQREFHDRTNLRNTNTIQNVRTLHFHTSKHFDSCWARVQQ